MRTILLVLLLTGCGAMDEKSDPSSTDYVMVSRGKVSLLYNVFFGGVDYCKVTKHGIPHTNFGGHIEYDGKTCRILVEAGGAISD